MGHALTALALPGSDPIHKVSIIPRGIGALGYTLQRPTEDRFLMTKEELERKVAVLLGGRVAEELIFNHLSTGASDDLAKTSDIARSMVIRYGMDHNIGHVVYENNKPNFLQQDGYPGGGYQMSDHTAQKIDDSVRIIIDTIYSTTQELLAKNIAILKKCAATLLERETLTEQELAELTRGMYRLEESLEDHIDQAIQEQEA